MKIIEKHSLWLRFVHWFNVPLVLLMIWSGLLIYWANSIYPGFFPDWFFELFALKYKLAEGIATHFFVAWLFIINGFVYLVALAISSHWRELVPTKSSMRLLLPTILHDLGFGEAVPQAGKFNSAQRFAYTGVILLVLLEVLSGFAIFKPVQLSWLTDCFGGYKGARLVHFIVMITLCGFILMHLLQVIRAGWNNFRAMVAGFEVEDDK
jgi:thiosulfate reductase cytochrome b subunit